MLFQSFIAVKESVHERISGQVTISQHRPRTQYIPPAHSFPVTRKKSEVTHPTQRKPLTTSTINKSDSSKVSQSRTTQQRTKALLYWSYLHLWSRKCQDMSEDSIIADDATTIGAYCELQIEAANLANMDVFSLSDPFALVEERRNGKWIELGRTETIWDVLNPKWVRCFQLPPKTPPSQMLRVTIYDRDSKTQDLGKQEMIGSCKCRIQEILKEGCNGKIMDLENVGLKRTGIVTIIGELHDKPDSDHELFLGQCKFRNTSFFGMLLIRPYITIYRRRSNNEWAPIYRSNARGRGEEAAFSEDLLHRAKIRGENCEETPLRIELRSHKSITEHKLIGAVQMSLGSLRRQGLGKKISLGLAGESVGELCITRSTLADNSSSFDLEVSFRA